MKSSVEEHGGRVDLLTGRTTRTPASQTARRMLTLGETRQDLSQETRKLSARAPQVGLEPLAQLRHGTRAASSRLAKAKAGR